MDGNGRWAKKQNFKDRVFGHRNGTKAVRKTIEASRELGVRFLTLYAFSTENWSRPKFEVNALMELLIKSLKDEAEQLLENNIRLNTIGDLPSLPRACREELQKVIDLTKDNDAMILTLALSYSSRWELTEVVKGIAAEVAEGIIVPDNINEQYINQRLMTKELPDPELLIRTSGEQRISNYLLWQIAYTELYFTDTLWPDFDEEELYKAIVDYQSRERRFGKISDQIKA
ncbi:isoprenyl transferase-like [Stigmatopora argus]